MDRLSYIFVLCLLVIGCHTESMEIQEEHFEETDYTVSEGIISGEQSSNPEDESGEGYCFTTTLIAGQHHEAGSVIVSITEDHIIITYITYDNWTIDATHLSIGGCDDESIPTNNSGDPQIGHFEYHSEHSDGINQVTYTIDIADIPNLYCFAAHAEVEGPTGEETAWAEGEEFSGNSWAMYVEANLSDCNDIILPE